MTHTENLNLRLYDKTDKMDITATTDSLNSNMKLIDAAIKNIQTNGAGSGNYLTKTTADGLYQPKGNYLTTKPTYTAAEVGALPATTVIPPDVSGRVTLLEGEMETVKEVSDKLVIVNNEDDVDPSTKIVFNTNGSTEVEIPTMADFNAFKQSVENAAEKHGIYIIGKNDSIVTYDYNAKTLTLPTGFKIIDGKGSAMTSSNRVLNLTNLLDSEACLIWYCTQTFTCKNKNGASVTNTVGEFYGHLWNSNNANYVQNPTTDKLVGYIYKKHVYLFGCYPEDIKVVDTADYTHILVFGDSIPAGTLISNGNNKTFHQWWAQWNPNLKFYNYGVGSIGYTEGIDNQYVTVGDGRQGLGTDKNYTIGSMHEEMQRAVAATNGDGKTYKWVIFAGTNDYRAQTPLVDFRSAVQTTLNYVMDKTGYSYVITPIRREITTSFDAEHPIKLNQYSDIIIEECEARGIPYTNGFDIGINPNNSQSKSRFTYDGLHPNPYGHVRIARHCYQSLLEGLCL